jgi:hypothetical protein
MSILITSLVRSNVREWFDNGWDFELFEVMADSNKKNEFLKRHEKY